MNQMEEMYRGRCGKRVRSFDTLSCCATLPKSPQVHQTESSLNPALLGFYGGLNS